MGHTITSPSIIIKRLSEKNDNTKPEPEHDMINPRDHMEEETHGLNSWMPKIRNRGPQ